LAGLGLSKRTCNPLERVGVTTVEELTALLDRGDEEVLKLKGIGPSSLAEIKLCVAALAPPADESAEEGEV
jgi:DNA-directed RNA polymerase alpha subunit